jgi:hypothetical protein
MLNALLHYAFRLWNLLHIAKGGGEEFFLF